MEIEENGACISLNTFDGVLEYKRKTENKIAHLEIALKEEKDKLEKFNKYMCYNCEHSWVDDHIDCLDGYRLAVPIRYCENCEMNYQTFLSITKS